MTIDVPSSAGLSGLYTIGGGSVIGTPEPLAATATLLAAGGGKIGTMAQFALGAYDGLEGDTAMVELVMDGWRVLSGAALPGLTSADFETGRYVRGNASAVVARSDDALVIAFRGTDDLIDRRDWVAMAAHLDLLRPLLDAVNRYVESDAGRDVDRILITGHSLGAGMATVAMSLWPEQPTGPSFEAVTFASPGYFPGFAIAQSVPFEDDRILNIRSQADIIGLAHIAGRVTGDTAELHFGDARPKVVPRGSEHSMTLYAEVLDYLSDAALDSGVDGAALEAALFDRDIEGIVVPRSRLLFPPDDALDLGALAGHFNYGRDDDSVFDSFAEALVPRNQLLVGGSGRDFLRSYGGDDWMVGGDGDDRLVAGPGANRIEGGEGTDTVRYNKSSAGVVLDLATGTATGGWAEGDTLVSIENARGSDRDDTIRGSAQGNVLEGLDGDDVIEGVAGANYLYGHGGRDRLVAGTGDDRMKGGFLGDTFVFGPDHGFNYIKDFQRLFDRIEIDDGTPGAAVFADLTITKLGWGTRIDYGETTVALTNVTGAITEAIFDFV